MNNEKIEEILKNIGSEKLPADMQKIAEQTSENFGVALAKPKQPRIHNLGDYIMKSKMIKLAAAAVIFIAVLSGIPFLTDKHHVALADVLVKVQEARAFMYKIKLILTEDAIPDMLKQQEIIATVSNEYGIKWEMDMTDPNTGEKLTQLLYVLPDRKMIIGLMPETRQYNRMELDDDWLDRMKKQNNDPREVIQQILRCDYTELGRSVLDGVEVVGFQTTDPTYFGGATEKHVYMLWVDSENWLPFRSEMSIEKNGQLQLCQVTSDYQWNIPVEASEFEPVIPEDFTAFATDGIKMPGISEEAAIEGLQLFVKMTGRYPKQLSMTEFALEIAESIKSSEYLFNELGKLKEEMSRNGEPTKEEIINAAIKRTTSLTQPLQSPGWFYMMLFNDGKEPVYYGESVSPDDSHSVLIRWKVSENEFRVIFGDLTAENVTAEKLAELEELSQN